MRPPVIAIALFSIMSSFFDFSVQAGERFLCTPVEVMEYSNRIHVKCSTSHRAGSQGEHRGRMDNMPEIWYLAVSTQDLPKAERFLSLATTSIACGFTFKAYIPVSNQTNAAGCLSRNCRTPEAFGVLKQ